MKPCDETGPYAANPKYQSSNCDDFHSLSPCGGRGTRGRALCGVRTPFWWYGGRDGMPRPGGDPDDYESRPPRYARLLHDIPDVLQRLEADSERQYLPGQMTVFDGDSDGTLNVVDGQEVDRGRDQDEPRHDLCSCRRETWVRGGPLGPNRPDPARGCRCICCRPRVAHHTLSRDISNCQKSPEETWRPRPPFWWWCHDKRSKRPGGDPFLYDAVFPVKLSQPPPPLSHIFEVDHTQFYLPGQIIFGFKPSLWRYWRPLPDECIVGQQLVLAGGDEDLTEHSEQPHCASMPSCSQHGGLPTHPDLLPSLICTTVQNAPPNLYLRKPKSSSFKVESKTTVDVMANDIVPYGWRGWQGVKEAHLFYRDLKPCCTRRKC